jgi:two-component system, NarL family, sensor histidine kinase DevS
MSSITRERITTRPTTLPLQALADALEKWDLTPGDETYDGLGRALANILLAWRMDAAELQLDAPPLPSLRLRIGQPATASDGSEIDGPVSWRERPDVEHFSLVADHSRVHLGDLWLDGSESARRDAARAIEMAIDLCWSRLEARAAGQRFDALDAAITAIAAEPSVDRILQLIVDRVRPLVSARYAALGILSERNTIERFLTSGMDDETRRKIGPVPMGRGILGLIIHENRSIRLQDVMTDPRRYGFPSNHPPMHSFLGVPVEIEGLSIGNLYLTDKQGAPEFTDDDQRIVESFARHAAVAIHQARLHTQLQRLAVLQERERIGQDLHDGVIQSLYGVGLSLEDMGELMASDPTEAAARIERAIDLIHGTIRDIRSFIFGLRPEYLEDSDLGTGLAALADEFRRSTLIDVDLDLSPDVSSTPEVAMQVLQLSREALSNIARHSSASRAIIDLAMLDDAMRLTITDNGRGFDTESFPTPGHHGLGNMRGRAEALGGRLRINSDSGGTRVVFELPLMTQQATGESMG